MSMTARSNIQQVAKLAGVSIATVSRAFAAPERLSPKTLELVRNAVRELDYTPNAQARSLRTERTMLVVALVPDISNPFFSGVIRGVESVAKAHGYSVLLGDTQYSVDNEQRYGDMVSSRLVDGLLTLLPRIPVIQAKGRLPVVNACEPIDDPTVSSVTIDNSAAFRDGVEYLVALGHRHIGFIGGPLTNPLTVARRSGYDAALAAAGLPVDEVLCGDGDFSIEAGVRAADLILSYGRPVTAFACASDELALGVMHALRGRGLSVPADVSVVGFDDISIAQYLDPPLTTIAQPREEMGREAMLMLLQLLADRTVPARKQVLRTQLVIRGSTAPPGNRRS
jgi:LacI family repressor for deo operon, udp, cdd, tsx, nupC, and nupG